MLRRSARTLLVLSVTTLIPVATSSPAAADHHVIMIREVFAGTTDPAADFVELQMYSSGQQFVSGHTLELYGPTGTSQDYVIPSDVANGENQRTMLFATTEAEADFEVTADFPLEHDLDAGAGAVCFDSASFGFIDCVAWGTITSPPAGTGTPAPAMTSDQSIQRTISRGCATLLDGLDDTNNSAMDFAPATPSPRPNSVAPTEQPCGPGGGPSEPAEPTLANLKANVKGSRATITGKIDPAAAGEQVNLTFFANGSPLRKVAAKSATLNADSEFRKRFKVPSESTRCKVAVRFAGAKLGQRKFRC
jgi:hypothetical protein